MKDQQRRMGARDAAGAGERTLLKAMASPGSEALCGAPGGAGAATPPPVTPRTAPLPTAGNPLCQEAPSAHPVAAWLETPFKG